MRMIGLATVKEEAAMNNIDNNKCIMRLLGGARRTEARVMFELGNWLPENVGFGPLVPFRGD